ncbi:integrase core domain-containing protein [Salipiger aestuarii]|uniref:integrase core domain-containing protein n=1 Tax=Salipiger aestuarii TaxID=568098 RepID=UPI000DB9A3A0
MRSVIPRGGKPMRNGFVERVNHRLRDECPRSRGTNAPGDLTGLKVPVFMAHDAGEPMRRGQASDAKANG